MYWAYKEKDERGFRKSAIAEIDTLGRDTTKNAKLGRGA